MTHAVRHLEVEVEVGSGEKLTLPQSLVDSVEAGHWLITVEPVESPAARRHAACLAGYAAEDEGLYTDDASR